MKLGFCFVLEVLRALSGIGLFCVGSRYYPVAFMVYLVVGVHFVVFSVVQRYAGFVLSVSS